MSFEQYKNDDKQYIANTYARFDVMIVKGQNATCYDESGNEYIDMTSGIGVNSLGFCDKKWVEAVSCQSGQLQHISNLYYTKPQIELAKKLCNKTGFSRVFFANSGAEANEGAIKAARKYSFDKYKTDRYEIITLKNSFHGRTITTLSATGQDVFHNFFFPFTEGFVYGEPNIIESTKELLSEKTCAIMIEVIQGEGGVLPLDKQFVADVEALCRENDLVLIVDEVQTGIGRTGKLLATENYGISPDIVTLAKGLGGGLPIGAILFNKKLESTLGASHHATTFGGNPVAAAGAGAIIDRVSAPEFLADVSKKGSYIRKKAEEIDGVLATRGLGLMIGIELCGKKAADVAKTCVANGLLVLTAKDVIRLLPPLTITYDEINKAMAILTKVIEQ